VPQLKLSQDLRPLADLKSQSSAIVRQAQRTGRPVVLTRQGRGVAVVLSIEAYEDLQASAARQELQRAVEDAERDIGEGRWVEQSEIAEKLSRWAGGDP
jgi:prevent-host-death family protein